MLDLRDFQQEAVDALVTEARGGCGLSRPAAARRSSSLPCRDRPMAS